MNHHDFGRRRESSIRRAMYNSVGTCSNGSYGYTIRTPRPISRTRRASIRCKTAGVTIQIAGPDLLDTVPGRTFVAGLVEDYLSASDGVSRSMFLHSLSQDELVWSATNDVSSYLYSAGIDAALCVDPADPGTVAMAAAIAVELSLPSRDTFTSPQHHDGAVGPLRLPHVTNRRGCAEVLPDGAFWTSTPLTEHISSWTYSRETNQPAHIDELHFDPTEIRVARIDSAADWCSLLRAHTRADSTTGTLHPDWVSIATEYEAVHLSLSGLLTAHPPLSEVAATGSSQNYAHSKIGAWAGVGDWSTVSTAWIKLPRSRRWTPMTATPLDR